MTYLIELRKSRDWGKSKKWHSSKMVKVTFGLDIDSQIEQTYLAPTKNRSTVKQSPLQFNFCVALSSGRHG